MGRLVGQPAQEEGLGPGLWVGHHNQCLPPHQGIVIPEFGHFTFDHFGPVGTGNGRRPSPDRKE